MSAPTICEGCDQPQPEALNVRPYMVRHDEGDAEALVHYCDECAHLARGGDGGAWAGEPMHSIRPVVLA